MKKRIEFRILAYILAVLSVLSLVSVKTETFASDAPNPKTELRTFIEWKRVRTYDDLPGNDYKIHYMFLAWTSDNKNPNNRAASDSSWCCITPYQKDSSNIQGIYMNGSGYEKVFFVDADSFTTSSPYGMPKLTYVGTDSGNNDNPQYYIKLDAGNGNYVMSDGKDHFKFRSNDQSKWGIAVKVEGDGLDWDNDDYRESAEYNGCVCIYYNRSGDRDNGFVFHGDTLTSEKDKDYDDFDAFCMWVGTEVQYTVITQDFAITPGNIFNTKDGLVIDNDVTVTVYPGGVFSVEGNVINNGIIKNYGTVVMNDKSVMIPMVAGGEHVKDENFGSTNANLIECYGSMTSVSVPGYKKKIKAEGAIINNGGVLGFMYNVGGLYLRDGATFENRGFLFSSSTFVIYNSSFINYSRALIGYKMTNMSSLTGYKDLYMNYPKDGRSHGLPANTISGNAGFIFYCSKPLCKNVSGGITYFRGIDSSISMYKDYFKD